MTERNYKIVADVLEGYGMFHFIRAMFEEIRELDRNGADLEPDSE